MARKREDVTTAYLAQVSVMRKGIVHRENEAFDRRAAATEWIKRREAELSKPGTTFGIKSETNPTLADAIDKYVTDRIKEIGRTKAQVLRTIKDEYDIATLQCEDVTSPKLIDFAKVLSGGGRSPATVGNYVSHLAAVFAIAKPAWGFALDRQAMEDAMVVLKRMGIIGKSGERDRRPTLDELDLLLTHYSRQALHQSTVVPMVKIIAFAIFSTRRQEEIVTIRRADLDVKHSRLLVRDMKHPGEKIGNDTWTDLAPEALRIVQSMPELADQIFPYTTDAISASFTRACLLLGINTDDTPDEKRLRFHDLRHDGVSRLFEIGHGGGSIPHIAAVSGHPSWKSLQRYAHIRQKGDKYAGWKWLDEACTPLVNAKITKKGGLPRKLRSEMNARALRQE